VRIGELAARSGVPVRMLRYYEDKGLLSPRRAPNGYREYEERDVVRVGLVTSMIRSGLPTRLIVPLLRRGDERDVDAADEEDVVALLRAEAARLDGRIACMNLSRRTIQEYLDRIEPGDEGVRPGRRPSAASRS
jgi:DNA-binding transcriptional MerR regulator